MIASVCVCVYAFVCNIFIKKRSCEPRSQVCVFMCVCAPLVQVLVVLAKCYSQKKLQVCVKTVLRALHAWDAPLLLAAVATCATETQQTLTDVLLGPAAAPPKAAKPAVPTHTPAPAPAPALPPVAPAPAEAAPPPVLPSPIIAEEEAEAYPVSPRPDGANSGAPSTESVLGGNDLQAAVSQLSRGTAGVAEKSACLRVIANLLHDSKPAVSPITTAAGAFGDALLLPDVAGPLIQAVCAVLTSDTPALRCALLPPLFPF